MLSPHEVAALILVGSATDHHDLSHADLEVLLELIELAAPWGELD